MTHSVYITTTQHFILSSVLHVGEKNFIGIGVCHKAYPTDLLPGWEEVSIAIHTEDGSIFNSSDEAEPLNLPCRKGSVIKCSLVPVPQDDMNCMVEFFKDGERVKSIATIIPPGGFYGVVGMMSKGEKIKMSPPMVARSLDFSKVWEVCTPHAVNHHGEGMCSYIGLGDQSEESIGTVRTKDPISALGLNASPSFEIRIIDPGEKVFIAIGVCSQTYPYNMLPGWKEISVGYHADNGSLFHSADDERPTNHPCKKGDTMRCTLQAVDGSQKEAMVVFHRNDEMVGKLIIWTPENGFYGCFGMMSKRESVQVVLPEVLEPYVPPKLNFLDVWQVATPYFYYRGNGILEYTGKGGINSVGTLRSKSLLDLLGSTNTFQVKILDPGESCYIVLGVCNSSYPTTLLPGWEDISVGFHADCGLIMNSAGGEVNTGCNCNRGDVLKCTIEPVDGSNKQARVVFHHNMIQIGKTFIWIPKNNLYAQVSCMSRGEVIQVASPQIEPSSLESSHPAPSMSVPATHSSYGAKNTPPSGQAFSRTTVHSQVGVQKQPIQHVHSEDLLVVHSNRPINYTTLVTAHQKEIQTFTPIPAHSSYKSQQKSHQAEATKQPESQPVHYIKHPRTHQMPLVPACGVQRPNREKLNPPHVPFEDALPTSPQSLYLRGYPLGSQTLSGTQQNAYYASQISQASAASDTQYTSQTSSEGLAEMPPAQPYFTLGEKVNDSMSPYAAGSNSDGKPTSLHSHDQFTPRHKFVQQHNPDLISITPSTHLNPTVRHPIDPPGDYPDTRIATRTSTPKELKQFLLEKTAEHHDTVEPAYISSSSAGLLPNPPVSTEQSRFFRVLHNVSYNNTNSIKCTIPHPLRSGVSSLAVCRLQLTEKMPYFEVELEHYEVNEAVLIGLVAEGCQFTAAYNTASGSVIVGHQQSHSTATPCNEGDVIGCRVGWSYKLETTADSESTVTAEWFRNGCSIAQDVLPLFASGYYPAICMTAPGTTVSIKHTMGLKPEAYFDTHPLPVDFSNFTIVPFAKETWKCIQNAKIDNNNDVIYTLQPITSQATVVQSNIPFTTMKPYFEVEVQHPMSSYSTFSLGVMEPVSNQEQIIPGEAPNSVGLLPGLGFVMRNGSISISSLPSEVTFEVPASAEKLKIGVGIEFSPKIPLRSSSSRKVRVFFTLNCQQICFVFTNLPTSGFFPTIATDSDFRQDGDHLLSLHFSNPQPQVSSLPLGFVRGHLPDAFSLAAAATTAEKKPHEDVGVQSLQAALPFSPSHTYYELQISSCIETSLFSCGLAPYNYSLLHNPGNQQGSIGFHSRDGCLFQDGESQAIGPCCSYKGTKLGCGARFPNDGSVKYTEIFFTLNGNMLARRLVTVPQLGLFPTVGICADGTGLVSIDLNAPDPFPDLQFSTMWSDLKNMKAEGGTLQPMSQSEVCLARLAHSVSLTSSMYFTLTPLSELKSNVFIGFSAAKTCSSSQSSDAQARSDPLMNVIAQAILSSDQPSSTTLSQGQETWRGCLVNISSGSILINDQSSTFEKCSVEKTSNFGCGFEPLKNGNSLLFFITLDNQVIFCTEFNPQSCTLFPTVCTSGPTGGLCIDACAMWPFQTPIGKGWARIENLVLKNSTITHTAINGRCKMPVGFAQAAMPLIPSSSYFEIEACSRASDKAIAIGLSSRTYPSNTWVGWKSNSIAYHLDDGNLFTGSGMFTHKIGPKIYQGHTVGCGIFAKPSDFHTLTSGSSKIEVFFTVNGAVIVTQKVMVPSGGFFPTICLESPTESAIFHRYSAFPPVENCVGPLWGNAYSMKQCGFTLEHSCKHKEMTKGLPRAFCQAKEPFSTEKPYFEVKIVAFSDVSKLQAGAALQIPVGCRTTHGSSLLYSYTGRTSASTRQEREMSGTERCGLGDVLGCAIQFENNQPANLEFYLNNIKVSTMPVRDDFKGNFLYPTITLSNRGDAVIPTLGLPLPKWDKLLLIGWLRSERVRLKGNIVEYRPITAKKSPPGVCQISHCLQADSDFTMEVEILDDGEKCKITVGVAPADYPLTNQPGWLKHSLAYHGDDGSLFHEDSSGSPFGPVWRRLDVIGLELHQPVHQRESEIPEVLVYFTRNGLELGHTTAAVPPTGLFPTIGFHSPGEKVKITINPCSSLSNIEKSTKNWRTLCGLRVNQLHPNEYILEYFENGRKTSWTNTKPSLAIFGEPFSENNMYFEVDLLSVGPKSLIAIGTVPSKYPLHNAPGWIDGSVGYHTDDGKLYHSRNRGKLFGPAAKEGAVIGCGINFIQNNKKQCSVFFTYNQVEIGRIRAAIPKAGFFPSLCLTHRCDKVRVRIMEVFKPKLSCVELHMVGLMRISNCSYSDQIVEFTGGNSANNPAPGIAQFAVPMHKNRNYFAAHILQKSDSVVIGLAVRDYPLKYVPGSTSISMAYNVTNGTTHSVCSSDNFYSFPAPVCSVGDAVGCGLAMSDSKTEPDLVFFTRNNEIIGRIPCPDLFEDLYPIIGFLPNLRSSILFMDWNTPIFEFPNPLSDC